MVIVGAACASSRTHHRAANRVGQPYLSETVDIHDGLGKGLRGLLRQIVTNPSVNDAVCIFARVLLAIGRVVRIMRSAIGITYKGDRRHSDNRKLGDPPFQIIILPLAVDEAQSPAVIVDHDGDIVRVVERRRGAIECGIVEGPFRGSKPPNELPEIVPIFIVAKYTPLSGEVILVPPLMLTLRR